MAKVPLVDMEDAARGIAEQIGRACPSGVGFTLLLFHMGGDTPGHVTYISNARREDMAKTMEELLEKWRREAKA